MPPEQETETQDMSVEQAVAVLVADLPKPVQDFVTGPERARITIELSKKYGLHVDTAGSFERAFIFMLLGISTPEEFVRSLQEAGLPQATIQGLATDVNQQVFMKLRDAEEKRTPEPASAPAPIYVPTAKPAPQPFAPSVTPQHWTPYPAAPVAPVYVPPPTLQPPVSATAAQFTAEQQAEVRTMESDMAWVKSGGLQTNTTPTPTPAPIYVPTAKPAPQQTPPASPIAPTPSQPVTAPVMPKTPAPQSENRDALHKILKQYGIDPYREPPE